MKQCFLSDCFMWQSTKILRQTIQQKKKVNSLSFYGLKNDFSSSVLFCFCNKGTYTFYSAASGDGSYCVSCKTRNKIWRKMKKNWCFKKKNVNLPPQGLVLLHEKLILLLQLSFLRGKSLRLLCHDVTLQKTMLDRWSSGYKHILLARAYL